LRSGTFATYYGANGEAEGGAAIWKQAALYGILLAVAAVGLQWLDYQRLARAHPGEIYVFLIALGFLALGLFIGARVIAAPAPAPFDGNPKALASLGISRRELRVLEELAAGHSNKEIAARLHVSPHTVKTHVARLLEKLDAKRRTDAIARARELGILQ
jgi:DNA-binding CsgD family transcriptional regulator